MDEPNPDACTLCGEVGCEGDLGRVCSDCGTCLRASWSGRCLSCHEARMLPPESFSDEYLTPVDAAGWAVER
jgi:hypothetical protein